MTALELDIAKEQAESLGLAGKKLQESIDKFDQADRDEQFPAKKEALLNEIAKRAWALMVQRELVGFTHDNLRWVRDRFDIPGGALSRLGRVDNR